MVYTFTDGCTGGLGRSLGLMTQRTPVQIPGQEGNFKI